MPYRGRPNGSYLIPLTVRALADATGTDLAELCAAISANGERVFGPWSRVSRGPGRPATGAARALAARQPARDPARTCRRRSRRDPRVRRRDAAAGRAGRDVPDLRRRADRRPAHAGGPASCASPTGPGSRSAATSATAWSRSRATEHRRHRRLVQPVMHTAGRGRAGRDDGRAGAATGSRRGPTARWSSCAREMADLTLRIVCAALFHLEDGDARPSAWSRPCTPSPDRSTWCCAGRSRSRSGCRRRATGCGATPSRGSTGTRTT